MKSATRWGIWAAVLIVIVAAMHFTGLSLMAVRTGSMRPGIQPGDAVIGISPTLVAPPLATSSLPRRSREMSISP